MGDQHESELDIESEEEEVEEEDDVSDGGGGGGAGGAWDVEFFEPQGVDVLADAVSDGNFARVEELLADPAIDPTTNSSFVLEEAVRNGDVRIIEALLRWEGPGGQRVNINRRLLVAEAAKAGQLDAVRYLLEFEQPDGSFLDASCPDNVPISWACLSGNLALVQYLLQWQHPITGARVDPRGVPEGECSYSLKFAAENGNEEIVEALLAWRGLGGEFVHPVGDGRCDPFWYAMRSRDQRMMRLLMRWQSPGGGPQTVWPYALDIIDYEAQHASPERAEFARGIYQEMTLG